MCVNSLKTCKQNPFFFNIQTKQLGVYEYKQFMFNISSNFPSSLEPLNHMLLSSASSFTKHAAVLTANIRDGFICIGRDAPGIGHIWMDGEANKSRDRERLLFMY